jgi:hypothetical protein
MNENKENIIDIIKGVKVANFVTIDDKFSSSPM